MSSLYSPIFYFTWPRHLFGLFIIAGSLVSGQVLAQPGTSLKGKPLSSALPFYFEVNQGQVPGNVKFITRTGGYYLYLGPSAAVLALRTERKSKNSSTEFEASSLSEYHFIQTKFVGANPDVKMIGLDKQPGKTNYLIGNNKKEWVTDIPHYAKVKYENLYPGIDLVYYMGDSGLEYDFIVHPGADPDQIQLKFNNVSKSKIDKTGNLLLEIADLELKQHKPISYQLAGTDRIKIAGDYKKLKNNTIGFDIASYDKSKTLIIDPVIDYSSYFGGTGSDRIQDIAIDTASTPELIYLTGSTDSPNLAGRPPDNTLGALGGTDIFVARLIAPVNNSSTPTIDYITYIGGTADETGYGIKVANNIAYVVGSTSSTTFPTVITPASINTYAGGTTDAFVLGLNAAGTTLVISTFIGLNFFDTIQDLTLGSNNDIQFALNYNDASGKQFSWPMVTNATNTIIILDPNYILSVTSGKVSTRAIFNLAGIPQYTYLTGIATGAGLSSPATVGAGGVLNPINFGGGLFGDVSRGTTDAFLARITYPATTDATPVFYYSVISYLGGSQNEDARGITAVNNAASDSDVFITGFTTSTNTATFPFPTTATAYNPTPLGGQDAFLARINITGSTTLIVALAESSFIGGSGTDTGTDIDLALLQTALGVTITGTSDSSDFPINNFTPGGRPAGSNAYVMRFANSPVATDLLYSGMVGGSLNEISEALAIGQFGQTFIAGRTDSTNFPTIDALQTSYAGGVTDGFFVKLANGADLAVSISGPTPLVINQPVRYRVTASNLGPDTVMSTNVVYTVPNNHTFIGITTSPAITCTTPPIITCNFGTTSPGSTVFFEVDMTVGIIGNYTHTASVNALDTFPVSVDPVPGNNASALATQVLNPSFCDKRKLSATSNTISNNIIKPNANQAQCVVKVSAAEGGGGSIDLWIISALLAYFLLINYTAARRRRIPDCRLALRHEAQQLSHGTPPIIMLGFVPQRQPTDQYAASGGEFTLERLKNQHLLSIWRRLTTKIIHNKKARHQK